VSISLGTGEAGKPLKQETWNVLGNLLIKLSRKIFSSGEARIGLKEAQMIYLSLCIIETHGHKK
jgi:hypothetical protein